MNRIWRFEKEKEAKNIRDDDTTDIPIWIGILDNAKTR